MLFRSHIVFSLFLYIFLIGYLPFDFAEKVIFAIFLFFATVFVDIDSRNSKIGNHWYLRPIQWIFSHRGMIHSLLFAFLLSFLIYLIDKISAFGFLVGYLSHLFLDFVTKEGIFLLWPFYDKRISFPGIKTGGVLEDIFFVLILLTDIYLIFVTFV